MIERLRAVALDDSGSALVEYGLIISLVSIVSYGVLVAIGGTLESFFSTSSLNLGYVAEYPK